MVEKCFSASNLSHREAIASDLLAVQTELAKTKQGPYLLRKLDIDGFANRPDQWRSKQASKQSAYNAFHATFGSSETKSSRSGSFLADSSKNTSLPKGLKQIREEIDHAMGDNVVEVRNKKIKNKKGQAGSALGGAANNPKVSANDKPFLSGEMKGKKRHRKDGSTKASNKKLKL
ncbi:hypothetical protein Tsubulata_026408 [Turnera subulata]|nr:hypothetical protein Tsubulata_026408 [Turnera subulata]